VVSAEFDYLPPVDVVMPDEVGPILVRGPVAVRLADGTTSVSGRPTVALCTCRRSRIYPFCDASHRRRSAPPQARRPGADAEKAPRK